MKTAFLFVALALASRCGGESAASHDAPRPAPSAARPKTRAPEPESLSLVSLLPGCDVDHRGLFLDLGTSAVDARRDHVVGPFTDVVLSERAGSTFARVHGRRVAYDFGVSETSRGVTVAFRALGVLSRFVTVYVDERRLGAVTLPREEPRVVSTPPLDELRAGTHTVTLRFSGAAQGADEPFAEVDWIRIGPPDDTPETYAAPTLRDIVSDVVLDGDPRRSIVLRSPSSVRCALRVVPGMKLRTSVGYWGSGHGNATLRVLEDGEDPVVLADRKVQGGPGAAWTPVTVDLEAFAGRVVALELRTGDAGGGGRVAFGEPVLLGGRVGPPPAVAPAKTAVLIVAAGLDRRLVPPWGPVASVPGIGRLVRDGVAFDRYRAPSPIVSAVVGSLLTGLSPRAHGLEDPMGRLDDDVRLLGERAREGSVHAAMFTGVPMSFPGFGFERGWDRHVAISPVKDVPATEPLAEGLAWLRERSAADRDARSLLVVHLRGGHPPWDVTRDEVVLLPPEEYTGAIEPRAGALVLSNLRVGRAPLDQRLSGDDWRRLHALEELALKKQDSSLRRFIEALEKDGLYDDALVVFMGDVATGDPPGIPFAPIPPLREDVLLAPLLVKFPKNELGGTQVNAMATTVDVTRTFLAALALDPEGVEGTDLLRIAKGDLPLDGRPLVATSGARYSTRFGPWLLSGEARRRPSLCLIEVDPACAADGFSQSPLAAFGLWRKTYDTELAAKLLRHPKGAPARATFDAETQSALKVFGY